MADPLPRRGGHLHQGEPRSRDRSYSAPSFGRDRQGIWKVFIQEFVDARRRAIQNALPGACSGTTRLWSFRASLAWQATGTGRASGDRALMIPVRACGQPAGTYPPFRPGAGQSCSPAGVTPQRMPTLSLISRPSVTTSTTHIKASRFVCKLHFSPAPAPAADNIIKAYIHAPRMRRRTATSSRVERA